MGKINLTVPKGHVVFKNNPNAKGERMLYLRYIINGEIASLSTTVSIKPEDWDGNVSD